MARNPNYGEPVELPPIRQLEVTTTWIKDVVEGEGNGVDEHVIAILQHFRDSMIPGATVRVAVPGGDDMTFKAI